MHISELLDFGKYYHIYNRGINSCPLFVDSSNNEHFLQLLMKHIIPVADIYSWALMKNHFHLLVRIKERMDAGNPKLLYQSFSNLFNAYCKAFNSKYQRTGSLFEHPFKRKEITDEDYLKNIVIYINNNPVHHGIVLKTMDYHWTSYHSLLSSAHTHIKRQKVISLFEDKENFVAAHNDNRDITDLEEWLGLL